jgi:hypothetical protein
MLLFLLSMGCLADCAPDAPWLVLNLCAFMGCTPSVLWALFHENNGWPKQLPEPKLMPVMKLMPVILTWTLAWGLPVDLTLPQST